MARLIIAEKPSLARAILVALPRPHQNKDGYIQAANGDVVTWCVGHLLEQAEPDAYNQEYKIWRMEALPIVPENWILKPRSSVEKQLKIVKKLLGQFDNLVHAGDPDREGQLLVDEVFNYAKLSKKKREKIQRLLINDLNLPAIQASLRALRSNQEFMPLSISALARARADWLYGINMTRAYTLLGKKAGFNAVLSVGRVQTPILGLVVKRDREIENFVSSPFYQLDAIIPFDTEQNKNNAEQNVIAARWQPSEACSAWQDEQGRVLSKKLVENVAARIAGKPAEVIDCKYKKSKQAPPLPYSLSALQIDAAKAYNMNAKEVLNICQSLYEKHKAITYPRSDNRYLPKGHFLASSKIAKSILCSAPPLEKIVQQANFSLKSKAWNDAKVGAHHAIIPTQKSAQGLSAKELSIYQLIARQYLLQFYPAAEYNEKSLEFRIEGGFFVAKEKTMLQKGWRVVIEKEQGSSKEQKKNQTRASLPSLMPPTVLTCLQGKIFENMTQAPDYFNHGSILQAMNNVARFVKDDKLKKILKETDGLGTEATRAGILDLLFQRGFLIQNGKQINASLAGKALIDALPENAISPDMTAQWEKQLKDMEQKKQAYGPFMASVEKELSLLIKQIKANPVPASLEHLPKTAVFAKPRAKKRVGRARKKQSNKASQKRTMKGE